MNVCLISVSPLQITSFPTNRETVLSILGTTALCVWTCQLITKREQQCQMLQVSVASSLISTSDLLGIERGTQKPIGFWWDCWLSSMSVVNTGYLHSDTDDWNGTGEKTRKLHAYCRHGVRCRFGRRGYIKQLEIGWVCLPIRNNDWWIQTSYLLQMFWK